MAQRIDSSVRAPLRVAGAEAFVGRDAALASLEPRDGNAQVPLIWVHGAGGVGKTSLLREACRRWQARGLETRWLDGSALPDSLAILDSAAALDRLGGPALVVLDDATRLRSTLRWAVATPNRLPAGSVLALGDRRPPDPVWRLTPDVHPRLRTLELDNLDREDAGRYLDWLGLPEDRHDAVFRMTFGHPLALGLVADVLRESRDSTWTPQGLAELPDVVETLLGVLVRNVPDDQHRLALRVGALVLAVTEDVLRAVVDDAMAPELFEWLQGLSFVRRKPMGLALHDVVRETVVADLQWRDRQGAETLMMDLVRYFGDRLDADPERGEWPAIEVGNVARRTVWKDVYVHERVMHQGPITPATERDRPAIEAMVEALEGPESLALLRYWWDRAAAIHVLRDPEGGVDAFALELRPNALAAHEVERDPAVRGLLRALPLLEVERDDTVLLFRHWMARSTHQEVSPEQTRLFGFFTVRCIQAGATVGGSIQRDPDAFEQAAKRSLLTRIPSTDVVLDGKASAVFANDFRGMTGGEFIVASLRRAVKPEPQPPLRGEFAGWVRQALRDLHHPGRLAVNPLAETPLGEWRDDPSTGVLDALTEACEALRNASDPLPYEVVRLAYLEPAAKQATAAAELGMAYGTYRRHLTAAVDRVIHHLWRAAYAC